MTPPDPDSLPTFFTLRDLAAYLQVSLRGAHRLIATGEIPSYKIMGSRRIAAADVGAYLARCRVGEPPAMSRPAEHGAPLPRWYGPPRGAGDLTATELAQYCGVSEATSVGMLESGEFDAFGDGSEADPWLVDPASVTLCDIWAAHRNEARGGPA